MSKYGVGFGLNRINLSKLLPALPSQKSKTRKMEVKIPQIRGWKQPIFLFCLFIWGDELSCLHLWTLKLKTQQSTSQQPFNWKAIIGRFCRFPLWCQTSTAIYTLSMTWKSREKYVEHLRNLWRPVCFQEASIVYLSIK